MLVSFKLALSELEFKTFKTLNIPFVNFTFTLHHTYIKILKSQKSKKTN
jgi:hypothetical protein